MSIPTDFTQPVGVFAQFMLDCAASAATVINPKFVYIGHYEWFANEDFYQQIVTEKYAIFIGAPKGLAAMAAPEQGKFQCEAELFFVLPADQPVNLIPIMTIMAKLLVAWDTNFAQWAASGNRNPVQAEWDNKHQRRHEKPNVCSIKITLHAGSFVVPYADDPAFSPEVI